MSYFLSHLLYIIVAGALIGFLAAAWYVLTEKNKEGKTDSDGQDAEAPCDFSCAACPSAAFCRKEERGTPRDL